MPKIKSFIPNSADNLHCLQACYAMIHNALFDTAMTAEDAEGPTFFREGFQTWQFSALLSFAKAGLKVINIENFNAHEFVKDPIATIHKQFGADPKLVEWIIGHSVLDKEAGFVRDALALPTMRFEQRIPTLNDIVQLIAQDYFVMCNVNSKALRGIFDDYCGHLVIIEQVTDTHVELQDPGLINAGAHSVTHDIFMRAWYAPDENAGNIMAVAK